jgi:eukaryotic-like serine/threonine-protein kinase
VVYVPAGEAFRYTSSENLSTQFLEFLLRSGHAVMYPIYKGTFERGGGVFPSGPGAVRDSRIQLYRDFGRSLDYLDTRPDIDHERLAYYAISAGAALEPILTSLDTRFRASVLI